MREGGTTSRERASMKRWFRRMADVTSEAAQARGRPGVSRAEFELAWAQFIRGWGQRTHAEFERFQVTAEAWRLNAYERLRSPEAGEAEAVEDDWIDDIDDEFGLMLTDSLWFILWRSGKPPAKAAQRAA